MKIKSPKTPRCVLTHYQYILCTLFEISFSRSNMFTRLSWDLSSQGVSQKYLDLFHLGFFCVKETRTRMPSYFTFEVWDCIQQQDCKKCPDRAAQAVQYWTIRQYLTNLDWDLIGLKRTGQKRTGRDGTGRDGTRWDGTGQDKTGLTVFAEWNRKTIQQQQQKISIEGCSSQKLRSLKM